MPNQNPNPASQTTLHDLDDADWTVTDLSNGEGDRVALRVGGPDVAVTLVAPLGVLFELVYGINAELTGRMDVMLDRNENQA
jgi:hypothetical protein